MFETILYPTDFSGTAQKSLDYIKQLGNAGTKKIILLNVINQRILDTLETIHKTAYFTDARYQEDMDEAQVRLIDERKNKLEPLAKELVAAGFEVKVRVENGHPVKEILKVEKEETISTIVLGSHGRNNIMGARIGTVSEKILRRATSTVLLVKV